ncbi:aldehyde dehydrogenase [Solirubrobacter sp. CPCC 204708]|uniref:Aldehyde dehydrogenase family protein n=1 Tax=Solirubrobacter deserti TaxID=2282478 RepID=A0ABT4RIV7_9ACTN|nr:aldehyde dehydrogenase family protein [Solirubrobacter deserti]MBE2320840.1 aldehyde dehydrogenase [Solirubrobacter deserti]MDA0138474.1 aldehyde dehydrogenase family protein [Solirubrobacter deserti]
MTSLASPPDTGTFDVLDPSTGEVIETLPVGDVDAAVAAARAAFPAWARTAPADRAAALKAGARRLREHVEELAELQTREGGKPLDDSRGGVEAGIGAIEQYAELGPLHRGRALQGGWDAVDVMRYEPRGVVALLVPWNDPVAIACGQIAAALVTGNAVVFKPSEKTPLTGARIVELLDIPGALQLLQGDARVGRPLAAHADVDLVMHTGSVQTGREIADVVAKRFGKALLELGGKDALIVDADVDPEWAAQQAALGAFANAGQICTSVERIYVHKDVAEPFIAALAKAADEWTIGPLINERQRRLVHDHVTDALERGARLVRGGAVPDGPGFFYPPTVLVGGDRDAPLLRDETFGPVAAVQVVDSFDTALELADRTEYGLAATVLTKNPAHAQRAARELQVGTVKINAVFGGAPGGAAEPARLSGSGFGYGPELLDELTRTKVVHMGIAP